MFRTEDVGKRCFDRKLWDAWGRGRGREETTSGGSGRFTPRKADPGARLMLFSPSDINFFILTALRVFAAVRGLSPGAARGGSSLVAVRGLLIALASPEAQQGPWGTRDSAVVACRLGCPAGRGIFPDRGSNQSPALVGGFLNTGPPGKSLT